MTLDVVLESAKKHCVETTAEQQREENDSRDKTPSSFLVKVYSIDRQWNNQQRCIFKWYVNKVNHKMPRR